MSAEALHDQAPLIAFFHGNPFRYPAQKRTHPTFRCLLPAGNLPLNGVLPEGGCRPNGRKLAKLHDAQGVISLSGLEKRRPLRRQPSDLNLGSLIMLAGPQVFLPPICARGRSNWGRSEGT